jgi:drug/metabolite transporter (DMT)-like permease
MTTRRDFLVTGGAALGALAIGPGALRALPGFKPLPALYTDAATRDLITPRAPRDVPPLVATLTLLVVLGAAGGIGTLAFETPRMPDMRETLLMVMAGATAVAGHFLLYVAYRMAAARTASLIHPLTPCGART